MRGLAFTWQISALTRHPGQGLQAEMLPANTNICHTTGERKEPCRGTEPFNSIQLVLPSGDILHLSLAGQVENEYFIWRSQYQYHWYWYKSLGDRWFKLLTPLTSHTRQIVQTGSLWNRKFLHNFGLISNVNLDEPCLNVCYIFCVELNVCFFISSILCIICQ